MCGIVGFFSIASGSANWKNTLHTMSATLGHRGPDDNGVWIDTENGIGLGHRRLSILDLSPAWHQPATRPAP